MKYLYWLSLCLVIAGFGFTAESVKNKITYKRVRLYTKTCIIATHSGRYQDTIAMDCF